MTKLYKTLATTAATAAMLGQMVMPAFAAINIEVSGNGSDSENEVEVERDNETGVFQTNTTTVVNSLNVSSNTGDNDVNDNTGGEIEVLTGDIGFEANILNEAGVNQASVESCDCEGDAEVIISGNGSDSENDVDLDNKVRSAIVQDNLTSFVNDVRFVGKTGNNEVEDNTGGSVDVETGLVASDVVIANRAGLNTAVIGGGEGGSDLMLKIAGNGSDSDNDIDVENDRETGIFQNNDTSILNDLYLKGITGENDVNDNTGAVDDDPALLTGDVFIGVGLFNEAGFNAAEADCGCVLDVTGSIMGNGTDSESDIDLELDDELEVAQDNLDALVNAGDIVSETGHNDVNENTSGVVDVETGTTVTEITALNRGGLNMFGSVEIEWPWE